LHCGADDDCVCGFRNSDESQDRLRSYVAFDRNDTFGSQSFELSSESGISPQERFPDRVISEVEQSRFIDECKIDFSDHLAGRDPKVPDHDCGPLQWIAGNGLKTRPTSPSNERIKSRRFRRVFASGNDGIADDRPDFRRVADRTSGFDFSRFKLIDSEGSDTETKAPRRIWKVIEKSGLF